jgi:splicing factor U2AF subunit
MYSNPQQKAVQLEEGIEIDDKETQQQFDEFYEDVFTELGSFGELEEVHVTGNLGGMIYLPLAIVARIISFV